MFFDEYMFNNIGILSLCFVVNLEKFHHFRLDQN